MDAISGAALIAGTQPIEGVDIKTVLTRGIAYQLGRDEQRHHADVAKTPESK